MNVFSDAPQQEYTYGMSSRPLSLGVCPVGFRYDDDPQWKERFGRSAQFGTLTYDQPLSAAQASQYELPLLVSKAHHEIAAQFLIDHNTNKHFDIYMEELLDGDPGEFAGEQLLRMLIKLNGAPMTLEDPAAFLDVLANVYQEQDIPALLASPTP